MKKSGCRKLGLALALAVVSGVAWAGAPDVSQIANLHAKESKYGPKGGPYDEVGIRSDAETLLVGACAG
jgi:hypothetical protein